MASSSTANMITLTTSDGEEFMVEDKVARECVTIRNMMEDDCVITNFPLPNVTSKTLSKVIEYCQKHVAEAEKIAALPVPETEEEGSSSAPASPKASKKDSGEGSSSAPDEAITDETSEEESPSAKAAAKLKKDLEDWDKAFINIDNDTLFYLILAANYLDVAGLFDLACRAVADQIKGRHPEKIRRTFNIENDFSPEEEEEIRKECSWAFEDLEI
ncbi:SKP1-like protein 1B [Rhynchospora pubera]|uniref:SKP1-like protein n=1 Tax=Rhynchospora pubera TaxID=906938 RepID=A0AAV8CAF3_9POAL|nr:SKP1-like protein 1B [Rhynchospora pubera]